jgi:acyl transferase domain-containing protein
MTIKAACASSMICLHQACQALREGSCDAVIVAGTNLIITATQTIAQTEAGVLSPTGQCRSFDASANGYARGEAINAILVKRLSDAVRDRDPIRAVVRGTAINCDGQSAGISLPNPVAHEKMIRRAYEVAGLAGSALDTPFVEAHGTGTPSGDPLELKAISQVFGNGMDTFIGSIKANIGHGEGASGLSSIIKAALMLEHRTIPPQVNFVTPNPNIPFDDAQLVVPLEPVQWPAGRPERISINSFGITGANAHAIIESAAANGVAHSQANGHSISRRPHLFVFSANTADSLKNKAAQIKAYHSNHPGRARDLSYTLACRRAHLSHRAFSLSDSTDVTFASEKIQTPPKINFVFTGQGAQWPIMGKELIEHFPQFRADLMRMNNVLTKLPHPPTWNLIEELLRPEAKSQINKAEFAQPLCTALQVALVNLLSSLKLSPSAVVGHSSGEIAAAYAAGAITAEEAITIAYYRGYSVARASRTRSGAMAAVGMGRAEATLYLEDGVVVACDNGPNSVTLSGDLDALEGVIEQMKADDGDVFVRLLKTDGMAYHSHHMLDIGTAYEEYLRSFVHAEPASVPFLSTVTGKSAGTSLLDAGYWRQNLESPVKFFPAVKAMIASQQSQDQLYLEIGPHSALSGPLRQIFKTTPTKGRLTYLSTTTRGKDGLECILQMCGQLYLQAVNLRLEKLTSGATVLTDLPAYPWQHDTSHWAETRAVKEW